MALSEWQKRAMEGMLQALEPGVRLNKGPALSPRLQALLEKKRLPMNTAQTRLEKKLAKAQETRTAETPLPKDQSEGKAENS